MPGGTAYARYALGFKSGGANTIVSPAQFTAAGNVANTFSPEKVNTYEIGYRTQLFDRKVQLTTAVFYNDYKNLQITKTGNPGVPFVILNAKSAKTYGAEGSVTWRVIQPLTLSANLGYLGSKYTNFRNAVANPVDGVPAFDSTGNQLALAAKWQGGASVNLDQPLNDQLRLTGTVLYSYISKFNFEDQNNQDEEQKGYSLVNLRVGVKTSDDHYSVSFYVKNLFNKYYYVFANASAAGLTTIQGDPRTFGATFEAKF